MAFCQQKTDILTGRGKDGPNEMKNFVDLSSPCRERKIVEKSVGVR